ncbi:hypothetical protein H5410_030674 [Solanum commersonii]|uniref:Uncharacterized protein n=1 Tax=Solanum commersonii TaxID=4109 RepID=A0A9J5YI31_SOLCO|nr:hypothetical protein H5410_030674 [Solanum commersonii]
MEILAFDEDELIYWHFLPTPYPNSGQTISRWQNVLVQLHVQSDILCFHNKLPDLLDGCGGLLLECAAMLVEVYDCMLKVFRGEEQDKALEEYYAKLCAGRWN